MAINLASGALTLIAHFLALDSPVALRKLLRRFFATQPVGSAATALIQRIAKQKIQRKIFAAATADTTPRLVLRLKNAR